MAGAIFDDSELQALAVHIAGAGKRAKQLGSVAVRKTGQDIVANAKQIAPRDPARPPMDPERRVTGNLKNSINMTDKSTGGDSVEVEIDATANYGQYHEFGTSRMPPRPFLAPSLEKVQPGFLAAMKQIGANVFD